MNIPKSLADKMFFSISLKDTKNVIGYYRQFIDYQAIHGNKEEGKLLEKVNDKYSKYMIMMNIKTALRDVRDFGWDKE